MAADEWEEVDFADYGFVGTQEAGSPAGYVTTAHWKPKTYSRGCCEPGCNVKFGPLKRRMHCHCCGYPFCESHSQYKRKLNAQAQPDPDGVWSSVCYKCFAPEPPSMGASRDLTAAFARKREENNALRRAEERRLFEKLTTPSNPPKAVVNAAPSCVSCGASFSLLIRRKVCQACGRVHCAKCVSLVEVDTAGVGSVYGADSSRRNGGTAPLVTLDAGAYGTDEVAAAAAREEVEEGDEWELIAEPTQLLVCEGCENALERHLQRVSRQVSVFDGTHNWSELHAGLAGARSTISFVLPRYKEKVELILDPPVFIDAPPSPAAMTSSTASAADSATDFESDNFQTVTAMQSRLLGCFKTCQEAVRELKSTEMITQQRNVVRENLLKSVMGTLTDDLPEFKRLTKALAGLESSTSTNVYLLLSRMHAEGADFECYAALLHSSVAAALDVIKADVRSSATAAGENWAAHRDTIKEMVECWCEFNAPLIPPGTVGGKAVIARCEVVIEQAYSQMHIKVGRDRLPNSKEVLILLRNVVRQAKEKV